MTVPIDGKDTPSARRTVPFWMVKSPVVGCAAFAKVKVCDASEGPQRKDIVSRIEPVKCELCMASVSDSA